MEQNQYAIMQWTSDGNKKSVHHLKYILTPKKSWNEYAKGDTGTGDPVWSFMVLDVGGMLLFYFVYILTTIYINKINLSFILLHIFPCRPTINSPMKLKITKGRSAPSNCCSYTAAVKLNGN